MLRLTGIIRVLAALIAAAYVAATFVHPANAAAHMADGPHSHGFGIVAAASDASDHGGHHRDPAEPVDHHSVVGLCFAMSNAMLPVAYGLPLGEVAMTRELSPTPAPRLIKLTVPEPPPR